LAGSGNDTVILGGGDTVFGDAGDDRFFAQTGGDNLVTGGAGADQFWIAAGELPATPNTVTDFTAGEDVIGIAGLGASFEGLTIAQGDSDAVIGFEGTDLATLSGIEASSLGAGDFAFA
jgi:Ca2+-binding RTX toxin-like protein